MNRTNAPSLAATAAIGALVGFVLEAVLVRWGEPVFVPPLTLGGALLLLGLAVPALAWPIRRATGSNKARPIKPVNPFYATRVVLVAKASAFTGSVLSGVGMGIVVFVMSRMVVVWSSVVVSGIVAVGGVFLVVGSLLAEKWCHIPPSDRDGVSEVERA